MNNIIYSATTGMLARQKSMNITSNNLANLETAGFKSSELVLSSFGEYMTYSFDRDGITDIGTKTHGVIADNVYSDYEQGIITSTDRTLDFAINGDGFFNLLGKNGDSMLTRNGSFSIDDGGYLVNSAGSFVMGENGKIYLGDVSDIKVSGKGVISADGMVVDTLLLTALENTSGIKTHANGELSNTNGIRLNFMSMIVQGSLEKSNVELVDEMSSMIEDSRAFQSCSQIVSMADNIMQKTVNEIGRV